MPEHAHAELENKSKELREKYAPLADKVATMGPTEKATLFDLVLGGTPYILLEPKLEMTENGPAVTTLLTTNASDQDQDVLASILLGAAERLVEGDTQSA